MCSCVFVHKYRLTSQLLVFVAACRHLLCGCRCDCRWGGVVGGVFSYARCCWLLLRLLSQCVGCCVGRCLMLVATDVACGSVSQVDRHVIVDDVAFGAAPGVATDNRKGCNHMLMFAVILATCCDHNLSARRLSLTGLCLELACVCVACHPAGCAGNCSSLRQSSFSKPAGCASVSRQHPVAGCVVSRASACLAVPCLRRRPSAQFAQRSDA